MANRSLRILRQTFQIIYGAIHVLGLACIFFPVFVGLFAFVLPIPLFVAFMISGATSVVVGIFLFRKLFPQTLNVDLFGLVAALLFACLYLFKVAALIYDAVFPTGLIGMINQLVKGRYPASFIAFPEIPANYHQGYVTLTAAFQLLSGVSVPAVMQMMIVCGVFYFAIWCAEILRPTKSGLLIFLCGLFLVASFPRWPEWFITSGRLDFTEYVTMGDMFLSTSFAWGMPTFALFFIALGRHELRHLRIWIVAAILIAMSLFHATLFSIAWMVFLFTEVLTIVEQRRKGDGQWGRGLTVALALAIAWLVPRYLPTAFLVGSAYEQVDVGWRNLSSENLVQLFEYLRLSGAVLLLGASILFSRKIWELYRTFAIAALTCFFFPIIFELKNINIWDNLHKFAVVNQFFCLLLFVLAWKVEKSLRWLPLILLVISIGTSSLALRDAFTYRTSRNPEIFLSQEPSDSLVAFLRSRKTDTMLYGYKHNVYTHDILSEVVNQGGAFLRTSYYDNFLLSQTLENDFRSIENWAQDPQRFAEIIGKRLRVPNSFVAVESGDLNEFKKRVEGFGGADLQYQDFGRWILVSYP